MKANKKGEGLYTTPNFDTKIRTMFGMDKRKSKYKKGDSIMQRMAVQLQNEASHMAGYGPRNPTVLALDHWHRAVSWNWFHMRQPL